MQLNDGGKQNESRQLDEQGEPGKKGEGKERRERRTISLWGWRWEEVSTYLVVSLFLLIAALVKLSYHHTSIHNHLPESW